MSLHHNLTTFFDDKRKYHPIVAVVEKVTTNVFKNLPKKFQELAIPSFTTDNPNKPSFDIYFQNDITGETITLSFDTKGYYIDTDEKYYVFKPQEEEKCIRVLRDELISLMNYFSLEEVIDHSSNRTLTKIRDKICIHDEVCDNCDEIVVQSELQYIKNLQICELCCDNIIYKCDVCQATDGILCEQHIQDLINSSKSHSLS